MMKSSRLEKEENIIKDVRNFLNQKKIDDNTVKDARNSFRFKKYEAFKDRMIRYTRNLFEHEEENQEQVTVGKSSWFLEQQLQ